MKVLFINDSTTNPNWGDRAAAISLMKMVSESGGDISRAVTESEVFRSAFGKRSAWVEKTGLDNPRERLRPFLPPVVLAARREIMRYLQISSKRGLIPEKWEDFEHCTGEVLGKKNPWANLLEAIDSADVMVIHGDGSMVGNGIHPRTLLFLSYVAKKHFGKAVIMVNHTADFDHPDLRSMAEEVYPLFDDVVFRDPVSAERCRGMCVGRFAADTAFLFKPASRESWAPVAQRLTYFDVWPDTARFDPWAPYLCIGGSSIFGNVQRPEAIVDQYIGLLEHFRSVYSGQIVLTVSCLVDQAIFRPVAERLELPLIGLPTPTQQAVDILGNADAYVGGRWHPSIFALRGGTPVLGLSGKTFKMQALTDMAGLSSHSFDALSLEGQRDAIGQQLLFYLEQGVELRSRLRAWAEEKAENSWDNVAYLKRRQERPQPLEGVEDGAAPPPAR